MPHRFALLWFTAAVVLWACGSDGSPDGDTVGSGGSTTTAAGAGGTVVSSCSYDDVEDACAQQLHDDLFSRVFFCDGTETLFPDKAAWDVFFAGCSNPPSDPLESYDWNRPVLLVPVLVPGCGGGASVRGVSVCEDDMVHIATDNSPGCCGCGDTTYMVGISIALTEPPDVVHTCGTESCFQDPMGCG